MEYLVAHMIEHMFSCMIEYLIEVWVRIQWRDVSGMQFDVNHCLVRKGSRKAGMHHIGYSPE
jgi:hypothetical protein